MMRDIIADSIKVEKVIKSCTTREQLQTAKSMSENFLIKHKQSDVVVPEFNPYILYSELQQIIIVMYNKLK